MRLSLNRPVKIIVLGAGGTGGYVIPHLYRIAYASKRSCRIIIVDGDLVEEKNLIRQNFAPYDIGDNKAEVLAQRYSETFGIETEYIPKFIESEKELYELLHIRYPYWSSEPKPISILIGAVDNNNSRIMCNNVFRKMDDIIYIDAGNGDCTGQVVCGVKMSGKVMSKPLAKVCPDILTKVQKFPSELSCADRNEVEAQTIAANVFASTAIIGMLYYLLIDGNLSTNRIAFSSKKLLMKKHV